MVKKKRTQKQLVADTQRSGRPPLPGGAAKSAFITLRVTTSEREAIRMAAESNGLTTADYLLGLYRMKREKP